MERMRTRGRAGLLSVVVAGAVLLAGCGGDPEPTPPPTTTSSDASPVPATDAPQAEATASLPPGAQAGLDDYDGDGAPDPTCGTQDFGGGLVLRIPCSIISANDPAEGTQLVPDSLFRLPGVQAALDGVSASLVGARDADGRKVIIVVFNSDNLFATGSDVLGDSNNLDGAIRVINEKFAGGTIQVRGHTDATGSAANNQGLSERRAQNVRAYLTGHGIKASAVTATGFGSTRPLVLENGDAGRAFNRRVELAIRLP